MVYPVPSPNSSTTWRTVDGPFFQRTRRISSSAGVGSGSVDRGTVELCTRPFVDATKNFVDALDTLTINQRIASDFRPGWGENNDARPGWDERFCRP